MSPVAINMFSTSSNTNLSIPKLQDNSSNWVNYKAKVLTALGAKGLIRHVDSTASRLSPYALENSTPVTSPSNPATEEQIKTCKRKIDEYDQHEAAAKYILLSTVSPRLTSKICNHTASGMWSD